MTGHEDAQGHRHFVADHLGGLAHAAEQRPFAAGAVAGQDDAEHLGGHDRQHEEDADVQRLGHPAVGERQGEEGEEGAAEGDVRPEAEEHLVGVGGDEVFLDEQLDAVGDGLQPAELAADAGGAEAILNAAGDLAFEPDEEDGGAGDEGEEQDHRQRGRRSSCRRPGKRPAVATNRSRAGASARERDRMAHGSNGRYCMGRSEGAASRKVGAGGKRRLYYPLPHKGEGGNIGRLTTTASVDDLEIRHDLRVLRRVVRVGPGQCHGPGLPRLTT